MATIRGIPLSKVSPKFLHANSTSHTWVFSAFAELIDNAYDPDVSASELLIDHIDIRGLPCLIFLDNGAGMDRDHLLKMLSFGFCEKEIYEKQGSHQPIGHYGNGFKSGSMRIGQDALVFTRCQKSACIGFLSQTYLAAMQSDSVVVPILEYRLPSLERIKSQESRNNLNAILEYSVFRLENELKEELKALEGSKTGTKVIISNLKRLQDSYELDFASDPTDIRCPEAHEADMTSVYHRPIQQYTSEYKCSLREYCSILFLRPRMKITIRGMRVKSKLISKSLSNTEIDMYKPTWLSRPVKIIFGFTCMKGREDNSDYGMMLYHRNRLIKPFEKVGYQKQPNGLGVGVVGVAQVDFLQPIHNKQDFNKDEKFHSVMAAFSNKLNDYWNEKKGSNAPQIAQPVRSRPDWLWAQCDHCLKWRRLHDSIDGDSLPELWYCMMNPDPTHNRCDIPEEPEDEDLAVRPTYEKTFKKKQEERKRMQQVEKEKEEETKRRTIMEKERELKEKEAALRAIQQVAAAQPLQENKTVMSLQRALTEARRKEEQQKRLILQIQEQKKTMEEQRNSLLHFAETLQTTQGEKRKNVLVEMSKLIGTLSSDSLASTSMLLGKRKSNEGASPAASRKGGKKMCIKTETGEVLSITQNDVDSDDNEDTDNSAPVPMSKRRINGQKENASPGEVETEGEHPVSASKPPQSSPPTSNSVKSTPSKRGRPTGQSLLQIMGTATENAPHESSSTKSQCKQTKKGTVMAVIDLTDDSEFGELVDVKSDLEGLRVSVLENMQQEEDLKPDKDALDEALHKKDDSKKSTTSMPPLADAKQEMVETCLQDSQAASPAAASECEPIHFQPTKSNPEFSLNMPEDAEHNLDTTSTIVHAKIGKDKQKAKHGNIISQNGVSKMTNSTQDDVGDEEGRTSDAENLTVIDNVGDGSDFDCAVDYDDSDYRAYSSVDEKGDSNESDISRRHCAVTEKSRSSSTEDGCAGSNQSVSDDADSVGKQDHNGSLPQEVSKKAEETNEAAKHASLDCHARSSGEYEIETREGNGSPDMAKNKCNDETYSPGNLLEADSFSKLSPFQENSAPSNAFCASENTNNSALVCEDHITPAEDNIDKDNSEPDGDRVQAVCSKQALNSDIGSSLKPSGVTCKNSVDIENVWEYEIAEKSLNQADTTISDTSEHVDQLHHIFTSSKCRSSHDEYPSLFPVENLSCPGTVTDCSLNRTHDEIMQTDLDMLAFDDIFELHKTISLVGKFHHQICHVKDKHLSEVETADKSLQASDLEHNTSIAESQTEDTDWVSASNDQTETLEDLQTKLSLRGQQLDSAEKRLTEIKLNIHKLLGFIVPGTELGGANNIDQIIKDMIRVHEESLTQTQSPESMEETSSQDDTSLS
ncbi:hypothetical protein BsWGS_12189 [Bradybaena similaris]